MMIETRSRSTKELMISNPGAQVVASDVLIHLHIVKNGGTSLSSMVKHGFGSDEVFESTVQGNEIYDGLDRVTVESCERRLRDFGLERIRYVSGHVPMGEIGRASCRERV